MDYIAQYSSVAIGAAVVLAGLIACLVLLKMFQRRVRGRKGQRLGITEYQELDESRRLVIVRRDNIEHLLLIGGDNDLVIESNIRARMRSEDQDDEGDQRIEPHAPPPIPLRPAPRAPVFADRRPQLRSVDPPINVSPRKFDDQQ